jgi:hypothetical protein
MTRARDLASATPGSAGIPFRMASGIVYGGAGATVITFPSGRFTQVPMLNLSNYSNVHPNINSVTATNFSWQTANGSNDTTYWTAIQMTSTSGAG